MNAIATAAQTQIPATTPAQPTQIIKPLYDIELAMVGGGGGVINTF